MHRAKLFIVAVSHQKAHSSPSDSSGYSTKHVVIRKEFWTYHICKIFPSLWEISRKLGNCVSFPSILIPHCTIPTPKMISGKFLSNFYWLHHETWNFTTYLFYESLHKVLSATVPVMRMNYATVDTRKWGRKHLSMTTPLLFVNDERTYLHLFVWARRLHAQFLPDCCVAIDLKSLHIYKTTTPRKLLILWSFAIGKEDPQNGWYGIRADHGGQGRWWSRERH